MGNLLRTKSIVRHFITDILCGFVQQHYKTRPLANRTSKQTRLLQSLKSFLLFVFAHHLQARKVPIAIETFHIEITGFYAKFNRNETKPCELKQNGENSTKN